MHVLMMVNARAKADEAAKIDPAAILGEFLASDDSAILNWHKSGPLDELLIVRPYVLKRIEQAKQDGYVKF